MHTNLRPARLIVLAMIVGLLSACGGTAASDAPTATPTVGTQTPSGSLAIVSHRSGDVVSTSTVTLEGTAPDGARVVHDISFAPDTEATASGGRWSIDVELEDGENEIVLRLGDDDATEQTLVLVFDSSAAAPTSEPSPTTAAATTPSPEPTIAPTPTASPPPTPSPEPTPEPTEPPPPAEALDFEPIKLEGRGDKVARFDIPSDAIAMATLRHSGSSNFAVWTVDEFGDESDLLVNEIGKYSGQVLFDERGHSVAFSITASGSWAITVSPIQKVPKWDTAEPRSDSGDAVLRLVGIRDPFSTISMTHRGDGNFAIWAYGESDTDLLVNEIGRYQGEALLGDAVVLEITADGAWSLAVNE